MSPFTMTATLRTPTAPEPILADTSAWYALVDRADANHRRAVSTLAQLAQEEALLLTHNYVVVETVALLQRRLGPGAVRLFLTEMLPAALVLWVTEEVHQVALADLLAADRRDLSLVDHVSFALMRHRDVDRAFAFDTHFAHAGFRCLP